MDPVVDEIPDDHFDPCNMDLGVVAKGLYPGHRIVSEQVAGVVGVVSSEFFDVMAISDWGVTTPPPRPTILSVAKCKDTSTRWITLIGYSFGR
jgi:hypothetical protein